MTTDLTQRWRAALARVGVVHLYRGDVLVGEVKTEAIASEIVEAMNARLDFEVAKPASMDPVTAAKPMPELTCFKCGNRVSSASSTGRGGGYPDWRIR